jgi:hypothetical protein
MGQDKPAIFVLWGKYFDECSAAAFVCELRAAGLRVRIVGIDGKLARGRHGLALAADVSLERCLVARQPATHVIVPCSDEQWLSLQQNVRVMNLLKWLANNGAQFLLPQAAVGAIQRSSELAADPLLPLLTLRLWPADTEAVELARDLARELAA